MTVPQPLGVEVTAEDESIRELQYVRIFKSNVVLGLVWEVEELRQCLPTKLLTTFLPELKTLAVHH